MRAKRKQPVEVRVIVPPPEPRELPAGVEVREDLVERAFDGWRDRLAAAREVFERSLKDSPVTAFEMSGEELLFDAYVVRLIDIVEEKAERYGLARALYIQVKSAKRDLLTGNSRSRGTSAYSMSSQSVYEEALKRFLWDFSAHVNEADDLSMR